MFRLLAVIGLLSTPALADPCDFQSADFAPKAKSRILFACTVSRARELEPSKEDAAVIGNAALMGCLPYTIELRDAVKQCKYPAVMWTDLETKAKEAAAYEVIRIRSGQ